MGFTENLTDATNEKRNECGGKGVALGEMLRCGIPVPPGFIVLTGAFDRFLIACDLKREVLLELKRVRKNESYTVERASRHIQELLAKASIPEEVVSEIIQSFVDLGSEYVAIRSSAVAEDSSDAAWAGQLESFLNVTACDVLEKVKQCWISFFSPRAILYRLERNGTEDDLALAVVIQKMVVSEKSGVAFSVHPVTRDSDEILIEAVFGLGEAIVSGQVTPDSYVVSKENGQILSVDINTKNKALYRRIGGGNAWSLLGIKGSDRVLSDIEIGKLTELIRDIEYHYGSPQDIEWAQEDGRFFITQSRPITTLKSEVEESGNRSAQEKSVYETIFESEGFSVFGAYLNYQSGYNELGGIISCEGSDVVSLYISKKDLKKYGRRGLEIYASHEKIREIIGGVTNLLESIESEINFLRENPISEVNDDLLMRLFDRFTEISLGLIALYKYTEEQYLFEVEKHIVAHMSSCSENDAKFSIFDVILDQKQTPEDDNINVLVKNVREIAHFKIKTREAFEDIFVYFDAINLEISRRAGLSVHDDVEVLFPNEIKELFAGSIDYQKFQSIQRERIDCVVISKIEHKTWFYFGEEAMSVLENIRAFAGENVFQGQIANPGKTSGRAVVVPYFTDSKNPELLRVEKLFQEGDILVAKNTTPEIMSLVKRAGAIVTEEGGITCHGAIVSREFGKPGVVGVKGISRSIEDGSWLEVDANNGIVRVIDCPSM